MTDCCSPTPAPAPATGRLTRRALIAGGLALGATPLLPGLRGVAAAEGGTPVADRDFGFLPPAPAGEVHDRKIMYPVLPDPVLGRATWSDTYLAPRSNGRKHEGQDLMGAKMLKLLACVNGTVVELRHRREGNSLYLKGDDGWYYCYLHVNNDRPGTDDGSNLFQHAYAPGLANGSRVRKGQLLGYLGDSGNAESTGAHLHFEIRKPNARWYNAAAVNPRYSLQNAAAPKEWTGDIDHRPFADPLAFVVRQAEDFLGRVPSWSWLGAAHKQVAEGTVSPDAFIAGLLNRTEVVHEVNPIIRLVQAYWGGIPAVSRVDHWVARHRAGTSADTIADEMAALPEFASLDDRAFCALVFRNLYGTEGSAASINLRIRRLASRTRGAMVRVDVESAGYRSPAANRTRVLWVYHAMVRRSPNQTWIDNWSATDRSGPTGIHELIAAHRTGDEYARRVAG